MKLTCLFHDLFFLDKLLSTFDLENGFVLVGLRVDELLEVRDLALVSDPTVHISISYRH